ncbi:MAG: YggT family protein [Syntrophorhabdaceae bacterium]|nr:YggT family protein [Syntrophorhabdaceae bacterium]
MFVARNFIGALAHIINYILWAYMWIFIIRAVLSWVSPDPYNPIVRVIYSLTEPVLSPLRRKLPLYAGTIDFSVVVALLIIIFLQQFLVRSLHELAFRMW